MAIALVERDEKARAQAIAAVTLAFVRDPLSRWLLPEPEAYLSQFPAFASSFCGPAFEAGTAWMSDDRGGAALWFPRGVHPDNDAIGDILLSVVDERKHGSLGSMFEAMDAHHPKEPHWYLAMIGVDAAHQGKGLGAQLLQIALERCDEEGLISYLESSNPANLSFYERHGFEVITEIRVGEAPPLFPMLRQAR